MGRHLRLTREVGAMVEVQAKRWTLRQKWHPSVFLSTWPVVTISHDAKAEGIALGHVVAERLGFSYWDRELVMELAGLLNVKAATSIMFDERTRSAIEEFLGTIPPSQDGVPADYTDLVGRIFDSIAHRGGAVIVGPGVQILVAPRDSLRVRLAAPLATRAWKIPLAHFDLVINTETYARETAMGLVLMAYFAKFGHRPLIAHGLIAGKLSEHFQ